jgi:hypothetical protein
VYEGAETVEQLNDEINSGFEGTVLVSNQLAFGLVIILSFHHVQIERRDSPLLTKVVLIFIMQAGEFSRGKSKPIIQQCRI